MATTLRRSTPFGSGATRGRIPLGRDLMRVGIGPVPCNGATGRRGEFPTPVATRFPPPTPRRAPILVPSRGGAPAPQAGSTRSRLSSPRPRPTSATPSNGVSPRDAETARQRTLRDGKPAWRPLTACQPAAPGTAIQRPATPPPPQRLHRQRLEVHAEMEAARQPTRQQATKGETARCDDCVRFHSPPTTNGVTARGAESTGQQTSTNNLPARLQPAA